MPDQKQPQPPIHHHHHHHHHPRRKRHPIFRWVVGIVVLLLVAIGGYGYYLYASVQHTANKTYIPLKKGKTSTSDLKYKKPVSLLLLGTDTGDLGRTEARGRTDTMIVITLNPQMKKTTMTSIPRDTMAQMIGAGNTEIQKINAAYNLGGAEMTVDSVTSLLNVPINYYAVVNMGGLTKIVDAVGGVDVTPTLSFTNSGYTFTKGKAIHMNGKQALAYSRMRYEDPNNDYGRQQRQQQIIMSILKAAPSFQSLANFKTLLSSVEGNLRTNLTFDDMTSMFSNYRGAAKNVKQDHMQGVGANILNASYQVVSTKELQRVSDEIRSNLGLPKATVHNEETRQNALNPNFSWSGTNGSGYVVHQNQ
ncbi:LCP family protein [Lacticaseibacillus baoqingensis]|uniref:LCP family protein n=1 Tax=Lacticaseibacillus baoqingensis TaxID=2486013 RepID=A0ABW4E9J7_9LACO|nr:LCP family protein [Lacticaseibacillus baoqingensis]